ncbi:hypothetical protein A3Q34_01160 [Colwellia sp. PAMC 20917]|nr:hypothetical protein A3Q34_01160 [Colwellia sp. PAMC 20917]
MGCSATKTYGPTLVSKNTYLVEREEGTFPLNNLPLVQEAEKIAVHFCNIRNEQIDVISTKTNPGPYILGNYPKGSVYFSCISKLSDIQRLSILNKSSSCITKSAIEFDDGISEVGSLSKAIVNECYDPCVAQKEKFMNKSESYFTGSCIAEATNALYKTRNITRQGGSFKVFNDFMFSKRKGDGHFRNTIHTFSSDYSSNLYFYCSVGTYNDSVNTHYLSLAGKTIQNLGLEYNSKGKINLSVNGVEHEFVFLEGEFDDNYELQIPLANITEYLNSNKIIVSNDKHTIVFSTKGYMDAKERMIKECSGINKDL